MKYIWMMMALWVVVSAGAQNELKLPDLGSPSDQVLSPDEEMLYRKNIRQQMYQYNFMMNDPVISDYIHHLGYRLIPYSENPEQDFEFHVVPADIINASAYPGGLVVIYAGLFLETETESELAGVVAHEIAHVTQRHISRMMAKQRKSIAPLLLGMVAAIAAAQSSSSGDAPVAIAASMQALQAQMQINFTRYHEYEADRVGIKTLHASGMNPEGMASFFAKLMQKHRIDPRYQLPEYLSTHPLSINRVTEAKNRIKQYPVESITESPLYPYVKERIRVLTGTEFDELSSFYRGNLSSDHNNQPALQYGAALHHLRQNRHQEALNTLNQMDVPEEVKPLVAALRAEVLSKIDPKQTTKHAKHVVETFPSNEVAKALMARLLMKQGDFESLAIAIQQLRFLLLNQANNPHIHDWLSIAYYNALKPIESGMSMARKEHLLGRNYRAVRILKNLKKQEMDYYQLAETDALIAEWEPLITEDEYQFETQENKRTRR